MYKYEIHREGTKKVTLEQGYNRIADCELLPNLKGPQQDFMEKQQKIVSEKFESMKKVLP